MGAYSVEQRIEIVKLFYENGSSVRATFRALRPLFGRHNRPTETTIRKVVGKFESTGSVLDQPTPFRRRNIRSAENIAAVRKSVQANPNQSISRRSQELGLSQASIWRIMREDLPAIAADAAVIVTQPIEQAGVEAEVDQNLQDKGTVLTEERTVTEEQIAQDQIVTFLAVDSHPGLNSASVPGIPALDINSADHSKIDR